MGNRSSLCLGNARLEEEMRNLQSANERLKHDLRILKKKKKAIAGVAWFNAILSEFWPKISALAAKAVKEKLEPEIQAALPKNLAGRFVFENVILDDAPLRFESVNVEGEEVAGAEVKDIVIKLNTACVGNVQIDVKAAGAEVKVLKMHLQGVLMIVLKELLDRPPFISGISLCFVDTPSLKMTWTGTVSFLPLLTHHVRDVVLQQFNNVCVIPKRIAVVLDETRPYEEIFFQLKAPFPPGCVHVHLFSARYLEARDTNVFKHNKSDPYFKMRVGAQEHRSKTIVKTTSPKWDEEFTFLAVDLKNQHLCMDVFDADSITGDHFLGHLRLSLADILTRCRVGAIWIALGADEDVNSKEKVQGEVQIMTRWMPVSLDLETAYAIEEARSRPQALIFMWLFSIRIPSATVGTSYTIEVTCNETTHVVEKTMTLFVEEVDDDLEEELREKIAKLRSLQASDEDIAEILSIPKESLTEQHLSTARQTSTLKLDEPFFWFIDVPMLTIVEIVVSQGDTELACLQVDVADCLNTADCMQRGVLMDGNIAVDLHAQVSVIGPDRAYIDDDS